MAPPPAGRCPYWYGEPDVSGIHVRKMSVRGVTYAVDWMPALHDTGHTLLLIHGFTGTKEVFQPFVNRLRQTHQLMIPDMLGHGDSDAPEAPARYTMSETIADLQCLLRELDVVSADVLGYSMGGRIALGFSTTHPAMVKRLIMEGASPGIEDYRDRQKRIASDEALAAQIVRDGVASFVSYWENMPLFVSQLRQPEDVQARQRSIRLQQNALGLAGSLRGMGTGRQPPYWEALSKLRMPVLLMTGQLDEKFTAMNRRMAGTIPNARHVVIEDAGHTPHFEHPATFLREVRTFLGDTGDEHGQLS